MMEKMKVKAGVRSAMADARVGFPYPIPIYVHICPP